MVECREKRNLQVAVNFVHSFFVVVETAELLACDEDASEFVFDDKLWRGEEHHDHLARFLAH